VREGQGLLLQQTLQELVAACPRLRQSCFWAGTSAIALEELRHRDSFDLDLHTIHVRFARPLGSTPCVLSDGRRIALPVVPGVLKHSHPGELFSLLQNESVARKYTQLALQKAVWQVLKEFPSDWLVENLEQAQIRDGRRRALRYLLGLDPPPFGPDDGAV